MNVSSAYVLGGDVADPKQETHCKVAGFIQAWMVLAEIKKGAAVLINGEWYYGMTGYEYMYNSGI